MKIYAFVVLILDVKLRVALLVAFSICSTNQHCVVYAYYLALATLIIVIKSK